MKKITLSIAAFGLLMFSFSCEKNQVNPLDTNELTGKWLLFETGYSPGSGYINVPVSPTSPQTMDFQSNGQFTSNIEGLRNFEHYAVIQDSSQQVLAFFRDPPTAAEQELENLTHSYNIEFTEDAVRLYFRWCFEGCHMALRPIDQQN